MRPIDADAVYPWYIKAFSKEEIGDRAINPRDLRFSMNDIKENLDNIPTLEQEPRWIPVSERLPKERGVYIVTEKVFHLDDKEHKGRYNTIVEQVEYCNGKWQRASFFEVVAWMPLPKPYKENEV